SSHVSGKSTFPSPQVGHGIRHPACPAAVQVGIGCATGPGVMLLPVTTGVFRVGKARMFEPFVPAGALVGVVVVASRVPCTVSCSRALRLIGPAAGPPELPLLVGVRATSQPRTSAAPPMPQPNMPLEQTPAPPIGTG